jgi:hypothetical protein
MALKKNLPKKPAQKKQHRKISGTQFIETLEKILSSALMNQDDLIITYETNPDDENRKDIHVLTGKLISPCMLGTLKNRVEVQEGEGSRRLTMEWE